MKKTILYILSIVFGLNAILCAVAWAYYSLWTNDHGSIAMYELYTITGIISSAIMYALGKGDSF